MQREMELQIGDRINDLVVNGPAPATTGFTELDPAVYTDPERHAHEMAAIAGSPVAALASSELAAPGDFVTTTLAGVPVIVTRDRSGDLHAMRNVCAHRGATVETRESGSARIFSCGFHAWSYDLDGSLRSVSDPSLFSTEPCTQGLRTLDCEERHGIIWVTPDADAESRPVADWLGPEVDRMFTELGLGEMVHFAATEYDLGCNWKLLTDGFMEIYHLKYLHRDSIAPYFPANMTTIGEFGDHFGGWLPKNRFLKELAERPRDQWEVMRHLTGAFILVPGTVVQWQAGHVELFSLRPHPTDPTRTIARLTMMVPADRIDETELWQRNWERVCVTIPDEDFAAAVEVQANIDAGAVDTLRIGANEHGIARHIEAVTRVSVARREPALS
ncbi:MAG: aromatic ring-hydroxylating dioxygenase subunit alpha [Ilumatobacter fluminis]|uniref:aromatic ring-hydroxylating oxygenase subunit alpha n=1 Tax=Ilumatobacter fluminis TaxID=467091 RepID=UPI0032EF81F7